MPTAPRLISPERNGSLGVSADKADPLAKAITNEQRKLRCRGGLASTLQARQQNHRWGLAPEIQLSSTLAQRPGEFLVKDANENLSRRQATQNVGAQRTLPNHFYKVAHYRQRHVCFYQGTSYVPDGILNVVFGQPPAAADLIQDTTQPFTQSVKHDDEPA
jgi:hypothetical protein